MHFVPQKYLRGFEDPARPGFIWMYDKQEGICKQVPIKQVAQAPAFYTDAVETLITEHIEKPANAVIDKIGGGSTISDVDRAHLAYYVGTMIRRVPHARAYAYGKIPGVLADVARRVREHLQAEAEAGRLDAAELAARLAETYAAEAKFGQQPPPDVVEWIETPWPTEAMLTAIFSMSWRFVPSPGPSFFLTSDNPASFFKQFGLGTPQSELVFPLCRTLALHCS
jgi:hypothetical protein